MGSGYITLMQTGCFHNLGCMHQNSDSILSNLKRSIDEVAARKTLHRIFRVAHRYAELHVGCSLDLR